jgi:hypothetical protein
MSLALAILGFAGACAALAQSVATPNDIAPPAPAEAPDADQWEPRFGIPRAGDAPPE